MRLIDADAFDKVLEDAEIEATRNRKYVFRSALNIIRGNLRNAPTIEERKKGEWISNSPLSMKCDQCGTTIGDWCWYYANFCPNCGADMRGEGNGTG